MSAKSYIYASAKLRALEPSILDQTDIERMVDAPDLETAFKVLNDTDYGDNLLEVEPSDYRRALSDDYRQELDLLQNITPQDALIKLMFLERDLVNLKLLFKAKYFESDINDLLKKNCLYPVATLKEYVFESKDIGLDDDIKFLIDQSKKELEQNATPAQADTVLTNNYFGLMTKLSAKIRNKLVSAYVKNLIDTANVLTWLRANRLKLERRSLAEKLIRHGAIDPAKLIEIFGEEVKNIRPILNCHYDRQLLEAFDRFSENNLLYDFERALEDYKTRLMRRAILVAAGPEVVLAYHQMKQNAVANIRIILTGKLNQIPAEEIKKTLRLVK